MLVQNCGYPDDMRILMEAQSLRSAGCNVTVICPTGRSRRFHEMLDGVRVYRFPKPWDLGGFIGYLCEYAYSLAITFVLSMWVLMRHGFDVIHSRVPPDVYVFLNSFYQLLGKRFVADLQDSSPDLYQAQRDGHGNPLVHRTLLWLERQTCRRADCLITINESYRTMLAERAGVPPHTCHVVRNAPDPKFLLPIAPLDEYRQDGRIVLGYMGVIGIQDRLEVLLQALASLRDELGRNDFLALVVGSGPALPAMQKLSSETGLDDHVRFVGYQSGDDLLRHVATFDIGITPDPSNAYNDFCSFLKTMEYMAMSKPVACFDLLENRRSAAGAALYAKPNSVVDLARQIVRLMDDAELRQQLGDVGRWRAANILNWERQEEVLLAAYESMLGGAGEHAPSLDSQLSVSDIQKSCAVESRPLCDSAATADSLS
jgi:glycosyltransferase involved in cell wall biosynthesis